MAAILFPAPLENLSAILVETGEARIVVIVNRHSTLSNLSACLSRSLFGNPPFTLKYQFPNEVIKTHSEAPKVILLGVEQGFVNNAAGFMQYWSLTLRSRAS
ncbi:uncharacterized protein LOC120278117 [Dioscorea cayenensis subsp. rotundata]|uniref:Uncharacterized protein LOC120278117 n=1 Tax=Dioscorea cayennensis subsp. rotundata TaxID=55577 RepID=A0AB40CSD3_DIOCR|nr:uncharacterized protein LOC120278117 [Dioscorea cayenensis subsp. rotundata]